MTNQQIIDRLTKVMQRIQKRYEDVDADTQEMEKDSEQWWWARGGMSAYKHAGEMLAEEFQTELPPEIPDGWIRVATVGNYMELAKPSDDIKIFRAWHSGPGAVCVRDGAKIPQHIELRATRIGIEPHVIREVDNGGD